MGRILRSSSILFAATLISAQEATWRDKPVPEWTEVDAKQLLTDSPWAKTVIPSVDSAAADAAVRGAFGGPGRRRGISSQPAQQPLPHVNSLKIRWESALPVREAELKAHENGVPSTDEQHYTIAVYGIPTAFAGNDQKFFADTLKQQAQIKREDKKPLKPSNVEVLVGEDGALVIYEFLRTEEINWRDHKLEFEARIGNLKFSQSFPVDEMMFHGKFEL